jgi:orotate phosphoribosyltransferase
MTEKKKEFIDFMLRSDVLRFGEFKTKSGRLSPYFINTGNYRTGSQISTLGDYYAELVHTTLGDNFDAMFGPAYKGIPLAAATAAMLYKNYGIDKNYFFNRKEQKDHGEGGDLVGYKPVDNDSVIIIEDVITAGTAVRETLPILKSAANVLVKDMFISVNRMEIGQNGKTATEEIKESFGIDVHAIITVKDIYEYLKEKHTEESDTMCGKMESYMSQYCIL